MLDHLSLNCTVFTVKFMGFQKVGTLRYGIFYLKGIGEDCKSICFHVFSILHLNEPWNVKTCLQGF